MTDNATIEGSEGLDQDYQSQLTINASADAVFDALTTLEGLAGWWTSVAGDALAGGELLFSFGPGMYAAMRVDQAERATAVRWSCLDCHFEDWNGTAVHFDLKDVATGGTEVRFRHAGLTRRLACFEDCQSGWDHFLASLRVYVETGTGNPNQSEADLARRVERARRQESANVG
jgi:uncharacterized protein YndB with AHSA1/START domain